MMKKLFGIITIFSLILAILAPVQGMVFADQSTVQVYSRSKDGNVYLTKNFKVSEFACNDGSDEILIDLELVAILQNIRNHFGSSVTITSAYRSPSYNKRIGGSSDSYHTKGMAADIVVSGHSHAEVAKYAETIGVRGVGRYDDDLFVHIDTRTTKYYWKNQSVTTVSTHGGSFNSKPYSKDLNSYSCTSSTGKHVYTAAGKGKCTVCGAEYKPIYTTVNKKGVVITDGVGVKAVPYTTNEKSVATLKKNKTVNVKRSLVNSLGNLWYEIDEGYIYSGHISTIDINLTQTPEKLKQGSSFNLKGTISSAANITSVNGYIKSGNDTILSTSDSPNSKNMNVQTANLNKKLTFGKLNAGKYSLVITVKDSSGVSKTVKKSFEVSSGNVQNKEKSTLKINLTQYPSVLNQGSSFGLRGSITSNYNITKVEGFVYSGNSVVLSTLDNTNSKNVNVQTANLNQKLTFGKLSAGKYTLIVKAYDSSGMIATTKNEFSVVGAISGTSTGGISKPNQNIQYGQSGTAVKELQQCLNQLIGANLTTDGIFGNATLKAVKSFQSKYGLSADGIAGPKTNAKINELINSGKTTSTGSTSSSGLKISNPNQNIQYGQSGTAVRELQQCLNQLIGANLTTDGIFGNATLKAVKSFQSKYGLSADGIAGPKTNAKINELLK